MLRELRTEAHRRLIENDSYLATLLEAAYKARLKLELRALGTCHYNGAELFLRYVDLKLRARRARLKCKWTDVGYSQNWLSAQSLERQSRRLREEAAEEMARITY